MNRLVIILLFLLPGAFCFGQTEEDSLIKTEQDKETRNAELQKPDFYKEQLVTSDTTVVNNTDLKVYLLFDQYSRGKRLVLFKRAALYRTAKICEGANGATIRFAVHNLLVKKDGIEASEVIEPVCEKEIISSKYRTNRVMKELDNGEMDISYLLKKTKHKSSLGTIEVERKQMQCDDTGINPMTVYRNGKALKFTNIHNLQFFEYDADSDGSKELYVLTYRSCSGLLRVYKIKK